MPVWAWAISMLVLLHGYLAVPDIGISIGWFAPFLILKKQSHNDYSNQKTLDITVNPQVRRFHLCFHVCAGGESSVFAHRRIL